MKKEKLAIIGSGISGLATAYLLSKNYDVHLYEKNEILGGHTRTIDFEEKSKKISKYRNPKKYTLCKSINHFRCCIKLHSARSKRNHSFI